MTTIKIDGVEYELDSLSEECKAQLVSLRFVDSEIARMNAQMAALKTARIAYGKAIKQTLEDGVSDGDDEVSIEGLGDSIEFDD